MVAYFVWVGGWVRRTPVVGHLGTVVPGVRLPRSRPTRRWRASPAELATDNPYRIPSRTRPPSPARSDKGHTRRGHPPPEQQRHGRKAIPPDVPAQAKAPSWNVIPGTRPATPPPN